MSVRTDQINLLVNINGNNAQNKLNDLRKVAGDVAASMKGLKKGTQEYIDANKQLAQVTAQMNDLKKEIGLTSLNEKELTAELRKLNALKGSVQPFSKEFKELQTQINATKNRLYDVKNGVTGIASVFSKVSDSVKQFGVVAAGYLGFQFITAQFKNIIQGAGKLSDQLADLQRVAGLTSEEAKNLNAALGKIDTRTSVTSLRDIAIVAGKLGVAKEDVFGFTKAVDQLVVSLGDELGDADQITTSLGKILNVFDGKITGDNISKLGNAFVELANTGAATGGFIAEFDQRLSGIAKSAGIGLGALSGLGAGLEEMGSRVESSTTAIQKLIVNINSDLPKAAQIAGVSLDQFKQLLKVDPTEAILRYSEGLVKSKSSFAEVVASLKDAGEEGARVIETISKLGAGADHLRQRIDLGKKAIEESTAITEAFALKNEDLGAEIDKLGKLFYKFTASSGMVSFVKGLIEGFSGLLKFLSAIPAPLFKLAASFGALVVAIALFNSGMIASARASLIMAAANLKNTIIANGYALAITAARLAQSAAIATQAAYITITNLLTGSIKLATAATRLWSIAIKTGLGPITLLVIAVGAIAAGVKALGNAFQTSATQSKFLTQTLQDANKEIADQQSQITTLTAVIKDKTLADGTHKKALEDLIAISPEYLQGLTQENIATAEGKRILDDYNTSLRTNANLKAASLLKDQEFQKNVELRSTQQELIIAQKAGKGFGDLSEAAQNAFSKVTTSVGRTAFTSDLLNTIPSATDYKDALKSIQNQIDASTKDVDLATDNYLDQQQKKDDARRNFLLHQITLNRQAMLQFKEGSDEFNKAQKVYLDSIDKFNKEFTVSGATATSSATGSTKEDPSVAARRKALQKLIDDSKAAYENLNASDKAGQRANLALREKYQKELDALDHKKATDSGNSEYKRLLKEAQDFYKSLQKLKEDAANASKSDDEKEIIALQQKYNELHAKALEFLKKNVTDRRTYTAEEKLIVEAFNREMATLQKKQFEEHSEEEYQRALKDTQDYFDHQRNITGQAYADNIISKADYSATLHDLDVREKTQLVSVAQDYSATSKKADADLTKFKKDQEKQQTDDAIENAEARARVAKEEALSKAQLAVISAPDGSKKQDLAKQALAQLQFDQDTADLDRRSELYKLKEQQLQDALQKIDEDGKQRRIQAVDEFAQNVLSITSNLMTALNNLDQREYQRDKALNDAKKNNYKNQLDAKLLSQKQYDSKVAKADEDLAKKKHDLDMKAFKRQQALAIVGALINGAMAVTSTLAARPGLADIFTLGAARAIQVGLVIAATAAQVAAIASQAPPEAAKGNWFRKGDKHKDPSGGIPVMIERDEAVVTADTMTDSKSYTVTGTPAQITSKLNSLHGGVNWASGAILRPKFREPAPQISSKMPRIMAQGGLGSGATQAANNDNSDLLQQLISKQDELKTTMENFNTKLHAVVSIKEYREMEKKYDAARKAAGMGG